VVIATLATVIAFSVTLCSPAAHAAAPWWRITSEVAPTRITPAGTGEVFAVVSDLGDSSADGTTPGHPINVEVHLPGGLVATGLPTNVRKGIPVECSIGPPVKCSYAGLLNPYERLSVPIEVHAEEPPGTETTLQAMISVEGGGASRVSAEQPIEIGDAPPAFGVRSLEVEPFNEDGTPDTTAGANPFQLTTTLTLNQTAARLPVALPKDLSFVLPPGFVGNPQAASQCSEADFSALVLESNLCPPSSVVGVAAVTANEPIAHVITATVPIFNLVPARGEPARLGFEVIGKIPVIIDTAVRSGRDYGVVATVRNATQTAGLLSSQVTLWGVPGDARHDNARGWECVGGGTYAGQVHRTCPEQLTLPETPFLRDPTSCATDPTAEPLISSVEADSWTEPGAFTAFSSEWIEGGQPVGLEGCSALDFSPTVDVSPEVHSASAPSGFVVHVHVPQPGLSSPEGRPEADVRNTTITLPPGTWVDPSAATGLASCSESQAGFEGLDPAGTQQFSAEPGACPESSKLGTARIETPLLPNPLTGDVYLADPAPNGEEGRNPFNSLVALYLMTEDPVSGVRVKLAGKGRIDESTGQVSTTFRNTPQVPFQDLEVKLFGGERASLSTPPLCGGYVSEGVFTSWASRTPLASGAPAADFEVSAGPAGGVCPPAPLLLSPAFSAQATSTSAGSFTHFMLELARADGQQQLAGLTVRLPPGIAALLSTVTPCPEPPAGVEWSCGAESLIGHSEATSGLGNFPVSLPGPVYLTSGYDGAPFGILVQTRAKAGPFDLGNVNVRSRIDVDPSTAQVTITTDPGPRAERLPVKIRGIPAQIKRLVITVDREGFEFNPTSCAPMQVEGTVAGDEGTSASVGSRFQVGGCDALPFAPVLTASSPGQASRADGTSFRVKITSAGLGQANIAKVSLQLPKQLPTRQSTIKLACPAAVFSADPATCDEGSVIGTAVVRTPVLRSPLTGPAYLVSHGGAAFPDVEFVLQGEGVRLVLDGKTDIKNGRTYSRFESAPDAPFTSFETNLPAGPHSALGVYTTENQNYNICAASLLMPTKIVAQNGKVIEQNTKIVPTGCGGVLPFRQHLTRGQMLAKALKACRRKYKHSPSKRARCERAARSRYAAHKHHRPGSKQSSKRSSPRHR
jgi:hypothetical protein